MAYVYRHVRLDKNQVFYVGIGSDDKGYYERAKAKDPRVRNSFWINITKKTKYIVEIMLDDLTWGEACSKEIEFIKLYGRRNLGLGTLCNLTDGGEGTTGVILSENAKEAIRKALTGIKRSDDYKDMRRKFMTGKTLPDSTKVNMSKAQSSRWKKYYRDSRVLKSMRPIIDLETGFFFDSVAGAARSLSISRNRMCKFMKYGKRFTYTD